MNDSSLPKAVTLFQQRFLNNFKNNRVSHALLFMDHSGILQDLTHFLLTTILCNEENIPCRSCQSCQLASLNEHPDFFNITPEKTGGLIKIEQIRTLHDKIFQTTLISKNRVICINPLDKLNAAGANALLKTLEEPPENTYFLLTAQQKLTIPQTILSRCQQWDLTHTNIGFHQLITKNELSLELEVILKQLQEVVFNTKTALEIASLWSKYTFPSLISLLYLINSQLIKFALHGIMPTNQHDKQLSTLAAHIKPVKLFKQQDKLNSIIKDIHHNININSQLTLEILLLGYP